MRQFYMRSALRVYRNRSQRKTRNGGEVCRWQFAAIATILNNIS
jgi:hypothetical protein